MRFAWGWGGGHKFFNRIEPKKVKQWEKRGQAGEKERSSRGKREVKQGKKRSQGVGKDKCSREIKEGSKQGKRRCPDV